MLQGQRFSRKKLYKIASRAMILINDVKINHYINSDFTILIKKNFDVSFRIFVNCFSV